MAESPDDNGLRMMNLERRLRDRIALECVAADVPSPTFGPACRIEDLVLALHDLCAFSKDPAMRQLCMCRLFGSGAITPMPML